MANNEHPNYEDKNAFTIYMGALSCMRHRGEEFYELQQQGKLAYLILNEIDYITGDYLEKLKDAARLVKQKHEPKVINIAAGCQGTLLSTDYDMLKAELEEELGIPVLVDKNCHLLGFSGHNKGRGHGGDEDGRRERGGDRGRRHGGEGRWDQREGRPDRDDRRRREHPEGDGRRREHGERGHVREYTDKGGWQER